MKSLSIAFTAVLLLAAPRDAKAGTTLYVALADTNGVAAIDAATNTVVATIGIAPPGTIGTGTRPFALAVSPDGQYVYVVNESCGYASPPNGQEGLQPSLGTVSVIATATNSIVDTVTVGYCPDAIAVSPDGTRAYVTSSPMLGSSASILVLDTSAPLSPTLLSTFTLPTDDHLESLALSPDGGTLYVSGAEAGAYAIDSSTGVLDATIPFVVPEPLLGDLGNVVNAPPVLIALTPDGTQLYGDTGSGNFDVVNTADDSFAFVGPALEFCVEGGLAVARDGKHAYLVDNECQALGVIDGTTYAVTLVDTSAFGLTPYYVETSLDSQQIYLGVTSASQQGELLVVDATTLSIAGAAVVSLGGTPAGLAVAAPGNTPASSSPVTVSLTDPTTGDPVTVTFSSVSTAGITTIAPSTSCPALTGYVFANPSVCFDLSTSATVIAPITVCVNDVVIPTPLVPTLVHNGSAVPTTTGAGTLAGTSMVCGSVSSLSPFEVLGEDLSSPSCALTGTGVNSSGQKFIEITVQDAVSGLASIAVTESVNATTPVPTFPTGTTFPVVVTATKLDQSESAQVALSITDVAGNVTSCDPLVPGQSSAGSLSSAAPQAGGCDTGPAGLSALLGLAFARLARQRRRTGQAP